MICLQWKTKKWKSASSHNTCGDQFTVSWQTFMAFQHRSNENIWGTEGSSTSLVSFVKVWANWECTHSAGWDFSHKDLFCTGTVLLRAENINPLQDRMTSSLPQKCTAGGHAMICKKLKEPSQEPRWNIWETKETFKTSGFHVLVYSCLLRRRASTPGMSREEILWL